MKETVTEEIWSNERYENAYDIFHGILVCCNSTKYATNLSI